MTSIFKKRERTQPATYVCTTELRIRRAGHETLDLDVRKRDEIRLVVLRECEDGVTDLFYVDCTRERDLLARIPFSLDGGKRGGPTDSLSGGGINPPKFHASRSIHDKPSRAGGGFSDQPTARPCVVAIKKFTSLAPSLIPSSHTHRPNVR